MECVTIFFSLLSMILAHSIMGKGGGTRKYVAGFSALYRFGKNGMSWHLFSMIPARYHWEKRKLNMAAYQGGNSNFNMMQGFTYCFSLFFP
jgi:hypothetical protein